MRCCRPFIVQLENEAVGGVPAFDNYIKFFVEHAPKTVSKKAICSIDQVLIEAHRRNLVIVFQRCYTFIICTEMGMSLLLNYI